MINIPTQLTNSIFKTDSEKRFENLSSYPFQDDHQELSTPFLTAEDLFLEKTT